jgi:hypothetical protein
MRRSPPGAPAPRLRRALRAPRLGPLPSALAVCYSSPAPSRLDGGLEGSVTPSKPLFTRGVPYQAKGHRCRCRLLRVAASAAALETKPTGPAPVP